MLKSRLLELQAKGEKGEASINDMMEILCAIFLSSSEKNKTLIDQMTEISNQIAALGNRIEVIEENTQSVLYTHVQEDDIPSESDDSDSMGDEDSSDDLSLNS